MLQSRQRVVQIAVSVLVAAVLTGAFIDRAAYNLAHQDFRNSNFFVFWLAGRMFWAGQNPYDPVQWSAGRAANGDTWLANRVFLYPLALQFFLVPLGLFTLPQAYFAWQLISEIVMALTAWILLHRAPVPRPELLFAPLVLLLLFFGPVYLTLQIGAMGALLLGAVLGCIMALERRRSLLAGMLLSLMMLKPSQGTTILLLAASWLTFRRDSKAILGILLGMLGLFLIGWLRDPLWVIKFRAASTAVLQANLGLQSNALGLAYVACGHGGTCPWVLGAFGVALILGAGTYLLWRYRKSLTAWDAFNIIIPLAFVSTVYLWSYDQFLYVIPIIWIAARLVESTKSYFPAFAFALVLVAVSLFSLLALATTHKDLLSILNTLAVLGTYWYLVRPRLIAQSNKSGAPAINPGDPGVAHDQPGSTGSP